MNKFWTRLGCFLAAGVVLISLAGCSGAAVSSSMSGPALPPPLPLEENPPLPPVGDGPYKLLCTLPHMNTQVMTQVARGVQDRCDQLGMGVEMHNSHDDPIAQGYKIDEFVQSGGQLIICAPVDPVQIDPFLQLAQSQGLGVLTYGENGTAQGGVWTSEAKAGELLGAFLQDKLLQAGVENPSVAALLAPQQGETDAFFTGLVTSMPQSTFTWHILKEGESGGDALRKIGQEGQQLPQAVVAGQDDLALSAMDFVLSQQLDSPPPVFFSAGLGASAQGIQALSQQNAFVATVSLQGYSSGLALADMALQWLQGQPVSFVQIPPEIVDNTNWEQYNYE